MLFSSPVSFLCRKKSAFSAYSIVWFKYAIWCMESFLFPPCLYVYPVKALHVWCLGGKDNLSRQQAASQYLNL